MSANLPTADFARRYILIENPGVAPLESFTLLGASNKAGTDAIGQFGSGTKFAVLSLLRDKLDPIVYSGNLRIQFGTRPITFGGTSHDQVQVKLSGKDGDGKSVNRVEDLSLVLRYGEIDWKDIRLACREFVSNALDACGGDSTQVGVTIVDTAPRAKAGTTRVYIPLDGDGLIEDFVGKIGEWFLHFAKSPWRNTAVLEKDSLSPSRIYRRGVFVREVRDGNPSAFNYNLNNLTLDEARVANDWSVKSEAARAIRGSTDPKVIARIIGEAAAIWEHTFDLQGQYEYGVTPQQLAARQETWKAAQDIVLGDRQAFLSPDAAENTVVGKGYDPIRLPNAVYEAAVKYGLRTPQTLLTADEREGRRVDKVAHPQAEKAVAVAWYQLEKIGATRGEKFPVVKSYVEEISGGSRTLGFYRDGAVYINVALLGGEGSGSPSRELFAVCLEELAHWITKATDNSRDFQEFFIQICTTLFLKG